MPPDELRKSCRQVRARPNGLRLDPDVVEAAADAWEAERAHAAADVCMWRDCEERNADLRKRLEAAEKACRMLAGTLSTFGRYSTMHPDEVLAEFAALAGEKP